MGEPGPIAIDGRRRRVWNPPMDLFLAWSRQAFRAVHGLPRAGAAAPVPDAAQDGLFAWARRHRMLGLLQAGLPGAGTEMQTAAYGQAQHTARHLAEAERLFAQLAPALPALALVKGPALAVQAWPDPGLRSFDDLDFLCARRGYSRLCAEMRAAGYSPEIEDPRRRAHLWHYGWGIAFRHPAGFMVEVNHRFFPPHYPWPCRLDARREQPFAAQRLEESDVRTPAPELHLLLGCLHAVWHGWARLAWLADIAGLLVRHPGVFPKAQALAGLCPFAGRTLALGCGLAESIFGPDLAQAPLPAVPPEILQEAVALLSGNARGLGGRELRRFHEQFMAPPEKAAYRLRRFCIPGDGDFRWLALPPALRGLYWLLRPVRAARL